MVPPGGGSDDTPQDQGVAADTYRAFDVCVCVCVFIKLHITTQSGPVILVILCVCVCVCVYLLNCT